ncbi:MAG: ATP-binding cassette domain-containing protein [Halanaerobiales bacterium]|nr:ATP-binding cassette domain-containing protein [Halanaerobiales bacterium]MCF8009065.1 ATP-binding cassette domain-containing protein [Halanaerobiales bacterium]
MFELKNVEYKNIIKVDNLKINEGEITCIVGRSGGGKSTFLKLLNNMISSDSGTIKFKEKEINDYNPIKLRREVLMLPQNPVIFSGNIRDNFAITLQYNDQYEMSDEKYEQLLKKVGLHELDLDDEAEKLSGGEKQRLALARILLLDPDVLLLDEPSSALDEETERLIIEMVVDCINEKNGTLVMVTHSKDIAKKYGDRIITINEGKLDKIS